MFCFRGMGMKLKDERTRASALRNFQRLFEARYAARNYSVCKLAVVKMSNERCHIEYEISMKWT